MSVQRPCLRCSPEGNTASRKGPKPPALEAETTRQETQLKPWGGPAAGARVRGACSLAFVRDADRGPGPSTRRPPPPPRPRCAKAGETRARTNGEQRDSTTLGTRLAEGKRQSLKRKKTLHKIRIKQTKKRERSQQCPKITTWSEPSRAGKTRDLGLRAEQPGDDLCAVAPLAAPGLRAAARPRQTLEEPRPGCGGARPRGPLGFREAGDTVSACTGSGRGLLTARSELPGAQREPRSRRPGRGDRAAWGSLSPARFGDTGSREPQKSGAGHGFPHP